MRLMILNGPNLNLLGEREPHIYGRTTLAAIEASCAEFAKLAGVELTCHQSNHEGVLVDLIQSARTALATPDSIRGSGQRGHSINARAGHSPEEGSSARQGADAIIINPAGYSFTSVAIFDALKTFDGPIFEVHISNIHARDEVHRHSKLSAAVTGVIAGLGPYGYIVAMQAALHALGKLPDALPAPLRVGPK